MTKEINLSIKLTMDEDDELLISITQGPGIHLTEEAVIESLRQVADAYEENLNQQPSKLLC